MTLLQVTPARRTSLTLGVEKTHLWRFSWNTFQINFFEDFATETNLYYTRETGNALNTNTAEIRKIFDMNILMGNMKLPRIRKYWQPATRIDRAADVKPVNRFFYFEKTFILCLQKILLKTIL